MIKLFQVRIVYLPFTYSCIFIHREREKIEKYTSCLHCIVERDKNSMLQRAYIDSLATTGGQAGGCVCVTSWLAQAGWLVCACS